MSLFCCTAKGLFRPDAVKRRKLEAHARPRQSVRSL